MGFSALMMICLQCFDAVGWAAGRASSLYKTEWWGAGMVICLEQTWRTVTSWCHCHSLSLASVKSRLVLPFWYWLTQVVPEKGPSNVCVCVLWWSRSHLTDCSDISVSVKLSTIGGRAYPVAGPTICNSLPCRTTWSQPRLCQPSVSVWKHFCSGPRSLTSSSIPIKLFPYIQWILKWFCYLDHS